MPIRILLKRVPGRESVTESAAVFAAGSTMLPPTLVCCNVHSDHMGGVSAPQ